MKKGILILGACMVLLLCSAGVLVAGYFLYFRNTPEKAFAEAFDYLENGDYYKYTEEGSMSMSLHIADFPEFDSSSSSTFVVEGMEDIQGDKLYSKTTTTADGEDSVTEKYIIGNDTYTKTGSGNFQKTTKDEEDDDVFSDILRDIEDDKGYTVLKEEEVKERVCFHYEVELKDEYLDKIAKMFSDELDEGSLEDTELVLGSGKFEIWVYKDENRLAKFMMTLDDMSFTGESGGIEIEISIDMDMTGVHTNWGEKVEIEAPI